MVRLDDEIEGTSHAAETPVFGHVQIDLGGRDVLVPEQLLHRPDVVSRFEEMGGEGKTPRAGGVLDGAHAKPAGCGPAG